MSLICELQWVKEITFDYFRGKIEVAYPDRIQRHDQTHNVAGRYVCVRVQSQNCEDQMYLSI